MDEERTVAALGESGLIARVRDRLGALAAPGEIFSGDDSALVTTAGQQVLFTTDVLVEGVDFELEWATGYDVGWKAIAVNVSDIAAMGGRPSHACVALSLPPTTGSAWVDGLIEGLVEASTSYAVKLVGGDVSSAREISIAVALLGTPGERSVTRGAARVGDSICVTGTLGGAAAGLYVLRNGSSGDAPAAAIERHLRPRARVEEGVALAAAGATAMIDVSDGLARDLGHILEASGVGCSVDADSVPVDPAVDEVGAIDRMTAALAGGEDFELLCTLPPEAVARAREELSALGTPLTEIGTVTDGDARIGRDLLEVWKEKAWEHLRDR